MGKSRTFYLVLVSLLQHRCTSLEEAEQVRDYYHSRGYKVEIKKVVDGQEKG